MTIRSFSASALAAMLAGITLAPASAQDLSATISCLHGAVEASDYAELGQNMRESNWDSKGGVSLVSDIGGLKLRVLDPNGNSVCQETANNSTACTFKVNLAVFPEFTIVVDNADIAARNTYRLCAF